MWAVHLDFKILRITSFALGIWSVAHLRLVPPFMLCLEIVLICLVGWPLLSSYLKPIGHLIIIYLLGLSFGDYQANRWLSDQLSSRWIGKNIKVTGTIVSIPTDQALYSSFRLATEQFNGKAERKLLQLTWGNPHPMLQVGERWAVFVRLKPPHALSNPNDFYRPRKFLIEGIHATGYVALNQPFSLLPNHFPLWYVVDKWRQSLQRIIQQAVLDYTAAAVLNALTIGVQNTLRIEDWEILRRTGTTHLLAISGLHVGLIAMVIYYLVRWGWSCSSYLLLRLPAQQAGAIGSIIVAIAYGTLAGLSLATQRAVIMILILMMSQLLYRSTTLWQRLLSAFGLILFCQPWALFAAGFWLSFTAVGWIAYGMNDTVLQSSRWRQWLRMQLIVFFGLMPLSLYYFQQFSLVSIFANCLAIPWIAWIIVPLCFLAAVVSIFYLPLGQWLFKEAGFLFLPLWHGLHWIAYLPFSTWHQSVSPIWMLSALLGVAWFFSPLPILVRWLGFLGVMPLCLIRPSQPELGAVWITLLDVGQGLAVVVQTTHHVMIYDTGAHIIEGFDAGRDIISPFLQKSGIKQINSLIISHGDNDHSGGAFSLLKAWPVFQIISSVPKQFSSRAQFCHAGQQWQWDAVPFRMLAPEKRTRYRKNNSSCVMQIGTSGHEILLVGDIEASAEEVLVTKYGAKLHSYVMIVPHHGSRTSSTMSFLKAVYPHYALFSLGFANRYHFPAAEVVARYQAMGVKTFFTSIDGAVSLHISSQGLVSFRRANEHVYFWQL